MLVIYSFLYCGLICMIGQLLLDFKSWSPGHVTSLFVSIGAFLEFFHIYDKIIDVVGGGAQLPIVSFGHCLAHASVEAIREAGFVGIFSGMFNLSSCGIAITIFISFIVSFLCKPKN